MNISIVIPLLNEEESLVELCDLIANVMSQHQYSYEVLLIDDGSKDNSWKVIENICSGNQNIKGVKFRRNYGKSAALNVGFSRSQGDVVITMDADLQDSPDEIPALYNKIIIENYDLVSGWKKKRYDPITKTLPTKLFNWAARLMSGIYLHDFNCGLKAYKNTVVKSIQVHGEMHRYIPVLAKWAGFDKITEKVVVHQARKYGVTKFGLERFFNGFLDLITITFVTRFGKKPMIPDFAIDMHTEEGRKLGRDFKHFLAVASQTNNNLEVNEDFKEKLLTLLQKIEEDDKEEVVNQFRFNTWQQ